MLVQPLEVVQTIFKDAELFSAARSLRTCLVAFGHDSVNLLVVELKYHVRAEHRGKLLDKTLFDGENGDVVYEHFLGDLRTC